MDERVSRLDAIHNTDSHKGIRSNNASGVLDGNSQHNIAGLGGRHHNDTIFSSLINLGNIEAMETPL